MGRYLKDPITAVGYALRLPPSGTDPAVLTDGLLRFDTVSGRPEYYYNGSWKDLVNVGYASITTQSEIGGYVVDADGNPVYESDGITPKRKTDYVMDTTVANATDVMVFIGGVYQKPGTNYTIAGNEIRFTSPPPLPNPPVSPNEIVIIYNLNSNDAR